MTALLRNYKLIVDCVAVKMHHIIWSFNISSDKIVAQAEKLKKKTSTSGGTQ